MKREDFFKEFSIDKYMLNAYVREGSVVKIKRGNYEFKEGFDIYKCKELHKKVCHEKLSNSMKKAWSTEEYRTKTTKAIGEHSAQMWKNKEYRDKMIDIAHQTWTKDKRKEQSERLKQSMSQEDVKQKMCESQSARWSKPEERNRQSRAMKDFYSNELNRQKQSEASKKALASQEVRLKMSVGTKLGQQKNNASQKISKASLAMWKNPEVVEKINQTKKRNASDKYSIEHQFSLDWLKSKGLTVVEERQYPEQPTLHCDAYIKEFDLWIEFHYHWTHYIEHYDNNDLKHKERLTSLKTKAETNRVQYSKKKSEYDSAIYTWTNLDVRKLACAKQHKLNYKCLFSLKEFFEYFSKIKYNGITLYPWDNYKLAMLKSSSEPINLTGHKCVVKEVSKQSSKAFLDNYHYQGSLSTSKDVRLGLFYEEKLIAIATFGKPRYNNNYEWEALRYCVNPNYKIIGGAKKLYNYFENMYKPSSIVSYQDCAKFQGNYHEMLGYSLHSSSCSTHWYNFYTDKHFTDNLVRKLGVDKLLGTSFGKPEVCGMTNVELLKHLGYLEVLDEGQKTFVKSYNSKETT